MSKTIMHIAEASGGVERYLVTLLSKMKKYSEYEHILVCSTTFDKAKFKGLVKSIKIIDSMHNNISFSDLKAIIQVRKVIKRVKPDIVYCHSSKAGAIGRMANIGFSNYVIYNAHGWSFNIKGISRKKTMIYRSVEKILSILTDKIVCISEYEKKSALKNKICNKEKLVVINNGIDFDEYRSIKPKRREDWGILDNAFVVGSIGRLTTQKAPDVFVKMAFEVKKTISEAFFVLVGDDIGDGHFRDDIEELIKKMGMEKDFLITGWVDNPLDYMGMFDVAVLLSRWEGFGLVLPEYMYMEKPIVATKADAIPYVVGDSALLCEIDNYKQIADSVIRLYKDNEIKTDLIEKGKRRVDLFDVQRTAYETKALFDDFINETPKRI